MRVLVGSEHEEHARWAALLFVVALLALGHALQIEDGGFSPAALGWLTLAFVLVLVGTVVPRPAHLARLDTSDVPALALAGLLIQLFQLVGKAPGIFMRQEPNDAFLFNGGLTALGVIAAAAIWGVPRRGKGFQIAALVAAHFALGAFVISRSPDPFIDVYIYQRDAIAALRSGIDPYTLTFPDIYGHPKLYGPGLSIEGQLQFGFPYFPLSLLLALPGQVLGGDHRYAHLFATELAAVLMVYARPAGFGPAAAVLFLTTPRVFFVIQQSWTEPLVVLGLAAVVFAACRHSRATPWLFGAFIAVKQYLVLAAPAALLLVAWPLHRRDIRHLFTRAACLFGAVTLPFVLWSPAGFWRSVVTLQFDQPFRPDALSYLALGADSHEQRAAILAFSAASVAAAVSLWRVPRTPAGFSAAVATTFLAFFAFNKQAFCNYYFFVIGALAVTLAAWRSPERLRS